MRPVAIELIEGMSMPPELSAYDSLALAVAIGRFSRKVSGATTDRIGAYFRGSGGLTIACEGLKARRAWRRASAAYSLGDMSCHEAVPLLLDALDDRSDEVRAAAVRSLGRLRDPSATQQVVECLVARRVPRGLAGTAVLDLGPAAIPELSRIARHDDPHVRAIAITVLGLVGDFGDAPVALEAMQDPSAEVRTAAAAALGRIGAADAESALRAALKDDVHFVRAEAATSLGKIHAKPAVPDLIDLARHDRFRPARAAAQAVGEIDPRSLIKTAASPDAGMHLHEAADLAEL
jgi:HEAT repeat protein